jgi:hypothetical protein
MACYFGWAMVCTLRFQLKRDSTIRTLTSTWKKIQIGKVLLVNDVAKQRYPLQPLLTIGEFEKRFAVFTAQSFEGLDWTNLVVCGGAIACCLVSPQDDLVKGHSFPNADIDTYMFDVNDPINRVRKVEQFFTHLESKHKTDQKCSSFFSDTPFTFACYAATPYRPVQLIRKQFADIRHILSSFDIDCCAVAYQGPLPKRGSLPGSPEREPNGTLWVTERAWKAFHLRENEVNLERRACVLHAHVDALVSVQRLVVLPLPHDVDLGVPGAAGLLEAVQRLAQLADQLFLAGHDVAFRLLHVDVLLQLAVQVGRAHVHLVQLVAVMRGQRDDGAHRPIARDGRVRLIVVDHRALSPCRSTLTRCSTCPRVVLHRCRRR